MILFVTAAFSKSNSSIYRHSSSAKCCQETPSTAETEQVTNATPKKRLRGRVAYDGSNYCGWQYQNNANTVQAEIERAMSQRFGELVRVVGASRTDKGVHAQGQAFHSDIPIKYDPKDEEEFEKLEYVINQMLPTDIRISHLEHAPYYKTNKQNIERTHLWSSIYDNNGKLYSYRFCISKELSPLKRLYCHKEWRANRYGFCEERMMQAIKLFEGTHDFSAFTNSLTSKQKAHININPVRTIYSINVVREEDANNDLGYYRLEFNINGALYKMIRNIVGTILEVSCFQKDVESIEELFLSKDRRKAPKSAPAHGLCLEQVYYKGWPMRAL